MACFYEEKSMKSALIGLAVLFTGQAAATTCELSPEHIGARYTITHGNKQASQQFELWRRENQVAHFYPKRQIAEIWDHLRNGAIRPVRYFDQYQRGIEYQPGEVRDRQTWADKWQLVSPDLLAKMTKGKRTGKGCDEQQHYHLKQGDWEIAITWLPQLQLAQSYRITAPGQESQWQLQSLLTGRQVLAGNFAKRQSYQTTDYTDIGDNESDPFLAKMINQGFVEHGASGMYNAQGESLEANHSHSHGHHH